MSYIQKSNKISKLSRRISLWIFVICLLVAMTGGLFLVNSRENRFIDSRNSSLKSVALHYARDINAKINVKKNMARVANRVVSKFLLKKNYLSKLYSSKVKKDKDGAYRADDGVSGAFASKRNRMTPKLKMLFDNSHRLWNRGFQMILINYLNFWLITEENFTRVSPKKLAFFWKANHSFKKDVFYSTATPKNNPDRKLVFTPIYYDSNLKMWLTSVLVPLYKGNHFYGVTGSDLSIKGIIQGFGLAKDERIKMMIFDANNNVVLHHKYNDLILGRKAKMNERLVSALKVNSGLKNFIAKFNNREYKYREVVSYRDGGELVDALVTPMAILDWRLVIYRRRSWVTIQMSALRWEIIFFAFLIALFLAFVIRKALDKIVVERLSKLTEVAANLKIGQELKPLDEVANDEIGLLMRTFFELNGTINRQMDEMLDREEKYRFLVEQPGQIIYDYDIHTSEISWSGDLKGVTGFSVEYFEDLDISGWEDMLHPSDKDVTLSLLDEAIKTGQRYEIGYRFRCKDESYKFIEDSGYFLLDKNGKSYKMLGVMKDISERKQVDEEKATLQEQLNHRRKLDSIGQLAGGVAHDFNNMLTGIMGSAELLRMKKRNLDDKSLELVSVIMQSSERAADLTAKLLAFGRKGKVRSAVVDMDVVIADTVALLYRTIDKRIEISVSNEAKKHIVMGDVSELQNVLLNIGINASHAMPEGGKIQIETANVNLNKVYCDVSIFDVQPGDFLEIIVKDFGCGIAFENLKKIFEPFFTTKKLGEGTGLGLAAAYGTIRDHQGAISVYSEIDKGTSFHILLPCSDKVSKNGIVDKEILSGKGKILLVDDEEIVRLTDKYMLEELGYEVILAENGREGVDIFREQYAEIDLVIMDMVMPEMNGREAFVKMQEIDQNCKVVISSGFFENENIDKLRQEGLAGFLHKPFRDYELSQLLAVLIY